MCTYTSTSGNSCGINKGRQGGLHVVELAFVCVHHMWKFYIMYIYTRHKFQGGDILYSYKVIHNYSTAYIYLEQFDFFIIVPLFQLNNGSNSVFALRTGHPV